MNNKSISGKMSYNYIKEPKYHLLNYININSNQFIDKNNSIRKQTDKTIKTEEFDSIQNQLQERKKFKTNVFSGN
jgi:hypothetical protein